jgi:mRNA-degrading endonuclease RelE of RelBE toxin-antitoxin system
VVVSGVTLDHTGAGASDIAVTGSSTLKGAVRERVGAWRIMNRIDHDQARVVLFDIGHRSTEQRRL